MKLAALCTLSAILGGFTLLSPWAQGANNAEQQVLATEEKRINALRLGDVGALRQIYKDDYTLVTPAGGIRTKSDQIRELQSGLLRYEAIEVTEQAVRVYGDVAIVLSRDKSSIVSHGQQLGGDLRFTRVYKKFGHHWLLIATHASAIAR